MLVNVDVLVLDGGIYKLVVFVGVYEVVGSYWKIWLVLFGEYVLLCLFFGWIICYSKVVVKDW